MEQQETIGTLSASKVFDWAYTVSERREFLLALSLLFLLIVWLLWLSARKRAAAFREKEAALRQQLTHYETVLGHLTEGACLYDAKDALILANRPFLSLYGLPAECAAPGTPFDAILRQAAARGHFPQQSLERILWDRLTFVARRQPGVIRQTLADGRTIAINHTPFEGGLWLATYTDITQLRRAEEQWYLLARYDRVTRLPNRFYFRDLLERALPEMSARQQAGLYHISIARLEVVAGLFGDTARDMLLQQVAQRLSACAGADNGLARLSDTAFAVLRPGLKHIQAAEDFASHLITAFSRRFDVNGQHLLVSASIGIAMIPRDGAQADVLLTSAEQAMRSAQSEGPGRYRLFQPDMAQSERTHLRVEHELARAIEREEFEVFYQPLVDLRTRRIASFEALVRWRHPVDGLVLPGTFIPVAESNGLMTALSQFVLRRACRDAANWPSEIKVAVNMSATQLRSISAIEWVKAALLESWLPPKRLEIELTESHFLDKRADGLLVLQTLRELGVSVALDDFGTGYASLSSLLAFGFDKIKIDRSFIEGMLEQSERREIVQAMLRLATRLGISSVAEGVESTEQLRWLRAEGCTEVQSFMLGAPMPAFAVMGVLQRQDALQILVA